MNFFYSIKGCSSSNDYAVPLLAQSESESGSGSGMCKRFNFLNLAEVTQRFGTRNLVGEGGFQGPVYRGTLKSGTVVAVQKLSLDGVQATSKFDTKVEVLSKVHHSNLVTLIGCCSDGDERMLVYEFMPHGCLEAYLHDLKPKQETLSWGTRLEIALGVARGLEHLHCRADPPIIYRDMRSANILLDNDLSPKLSGLPKVGPGRDQPYGTIGTYGYCAPDYAMTLKLTFQSDIYSFGIVLLELITGRRAVVLTTVGTVDYLADWAAPLLKDRKNLHQHPLQEQKIFESGIKMIMKAKRADSRLLCSWISSSQK